MKNKIFITLFLIMFSITGCSKNVKTITCTSTEYLDGETENLKYTISYTDNYVTNLYSVVEIINDDKDKLKEYALEVQPQCEKINSIKYIECSYELRDNIFTYTINDNLEKVDFDKLAEIGMGTFEIQSPDGKIPLNYLINDYKSSGMTCK